MPSNYGHRDYGEDLYSLRPALDFAGDIVIPWAFFANMAVAGVKKFEGIINFDIAFAGGLQLTRPFLANINVVVDFTGAGLEIYLGPFWKPDQPIDEFWVPDTPVDGFWVPDTPVNGGWTAISAGSEFWVPDTPVRPVWTKIPQERPGG